MSKGKELVVRDYRFMELTNLDAIKENLGTEGISPFALDMVKVPSGGAISFEIPTIEGEVQSVKELVGVLIHWIPVRQYFKSAFTGDSTPPDCASFDAIIGIGNPGGACSSCPYSKFGSAPDLVSQACKQGRLLYFMLQDKLLPIIVKVPPTSIRPIQKYLLQLSSDGQRYWHVETALRLETDKSKTGIKYSVIKPGRAGILDGKRREFSDLYRQNILAAVRQGPQDAKDIES